MPKSGARKWALRAIALDCHLDEELKWGKPCYTVDGGNIAIIQDFKDYCAIMFFKGALLQDLENLLVSPGSSQAARQMRFTRLDEIAAQEAALRLYIAEAVAVEKAGLKVKLRVNFRLHSSGRISNQVG